MKIKYHDYRFKADTRAMIETANAIIEEYQAAGYSLTLRQIYYQHVARGLIENTERSYKRLGSIINKARLAGLIDWTAIEDRTRFVRSLNHWSSPADIIKTAADQFRLDKWGGQETRVEVWVEKDALISIVETVCNDFDIAFMSCRGYVSQSEMWAAARRLGGYHVGGFGRLVLVHLGDHDPSGIDMTRDIQDRLDMFDAGVTVERVALNMDQIEKFKPPPNPAKMTDSRFSGYLAKYGDESWELDALDPASLSKIIYDAVEPYLDRDKWNAVEEVEGIQRSDLVGVSESWDEIVANLREGK